MEFETLQTTRNTLCNFNNAQARKTWTDQDVKNRKYLPEMKNEKQYERLLRSILSAYHCVEMTRRIVID